jgi:type I restriction enzyme, S subunit
VSTAKDPTMPTWTLTTLGRVADSIRNGISTKPSAERGLPILRISAVRPGTLDVNDVRYLPDRDAEQYRQFVLTEGDLLFTRYNGSRDFVGACATVPALPTELVYPDKLIRVRVNRQIVEPRFVAHAMAAGVSRVFIESRARTTAGQTGISGADVKSIPLLLPPLSEQRRIVAALEEHLSELDAAVAGLERAVSNVQRYRAAVLRDACEGRIALGVTAQPPSHDRDPSAAPPSALKGAVAPDLTDLPRVPNGWSVQSLDQLMGKITSGSRDWSKFYDRGTGTFIMAQNVRPGRLDLTFRQAVDPPLHDRDRQRSQVRPGDVLVTIVGANTGDACLVPVELPEHYVCQSVALLRPRVPELGRWIGMYLSSPQNGQKQFARYMYGAGRPHLSFEQLRMTAVLIPPPEQREAILAEVDRRLSIVDRSIAQIEVQHSRARALRQSILKRAFEGRLVPQDPNDAPASVLLERIHPGRVAHGPTSVREDPLARKRTPPSIR